MVRIGLAGYGFVGRLHLAAFAALDDAEVVAVAGRGDAPDGVRLHLDPLDLINDPEVDAVVIALPTTLHMQVATAAVGLGKPVLVEKPMSLDLAEATEFAAVVESSGVPVQVAQVLRHTEQSVELAQLLRSDDFGAPVDLTFSRECAAPDWSDWSLDPEQSGGALYDLMIHDLDFIHSVYGMPESVSAVAHESRPGALDHVIVRLSHGGGMPFSVQTTASWRMPGTYPFTTRSRCLGTQQAIETQTRSSAVQIDEGGEAVTTVFGSQVVRKVYRTKPLDPFIQQARSFVDVVKDPRLSPNPGVEEALAVLRIVEAARESIKSGASTPLAGPSNTRSQ